jgi:dipeptidyl aminopeptidase/acylaminoacyl peptidase
MRRVVTALAASVLLTSMPASAVPPESKSGVKASATEPRRASVTETPGPRPFTLEDLLTLSSLADPVWSPDGRRLAFVVTAADTAENANNQDLWLLDLAEDRRGQLTRHPKNDFSPTFSPGGDTLAFVATRGSGEDAKPAIYLLSLRGGDPWPFGSYDEAVSEVEWSPDGRWLAYVKLDTLSKQAREWKKKKWDQVIEDQRLQYPQLWVTEIATGAQRRLTMPGEFVWHARWSPDSKRIAFLVSPTGRVDDENLADIGIVAVTGGAVRKLGVLGAPFAWSPDGRWLAWAGGSDRSKYVEKSDLWVADVAGAAGGAAGAAHDFGRPVNLTAGFDEDAKEPAWSPGSDTLYFHSARGVSTALASVPRAGGPVTLGPDLQAEAGAPVIAAGGRAAWIQAGATEPVELWVADHAGLPGRKTTAVNAGLSGRAFGSTRSVRWISTDGVAVEGLLLRPPGAPERAALKTLVLLHGGPYTAHYALGFQAGAQFFAARGYQVFMPNFRSSGGYGTAFMLRQRSDWGFQDWKDVESGVDSLASWGLADPKRLGVYGGSYGGYLSAWAITQTDRFKAASVLAGAVELTSLYGQSDTQKYRAFEFEGRPWETPENWRRSSPYTHIGNVKTPTQILIGENDPRIPYPQGQQLYRALLALGVPVEFVHYPREGHGLREPRHRADQFTRMLAWWDRWLK